MASSNDRKFESFVSFGPPKECDSTGVIGSSSRSLIEGFLQVNVPKKVLKDYGDAQAMQEAESEQKGNNEQKQNDPENEQDQIGEAFYVNEDNEEFPYYWYVFINIYYNFT